MRCDRSLPCARRSSCDTFKLALLCTAMDHPCHKCGHSVEDGKPFCAQCGAPQIRVAMPERGRQSVAGNVSSNDPAIYSLAAIRFSGAARPRRLEAFSGFPPGSSGRRPCGPARFAALISGTGHGAWPDGSSAGRVGCRISGRHSLSPPESGLECQRALRSATRRALRLSLLRDLGYFRDARGRRVSHRRAVRQKMLEALQQAASRSNDPQVQAAFDRLKTPEGFAVMLVLAWWSYSWFPIAAGSIAGALTGAFLGRRNRP